MPQPSVCKNIENIKASKIDIIYCKLQYVDNIMLFVSNRNFDLENVSDLDPLPSPQAELELPSPVCRPDEPSPTVDTPYETAFRK